MKRRDFIALGAAGLVVPRFLVGCGPKGAPATALEPLPANPFMAWFGIDDAVLRKVMSRLTANGADIADLYFQHKRSNKISLEDGLISKASTQVEQGVGLRVVVGDQTGYAFTEDLSLASMLAAADTAAAIAKGAPLSAPEVFTVGQMPSPYALAVPWSEVGVDRKLPLIERLAVLAKEKEPSIEKVSVSWSDVEERILVATLSGHIYTDTRPMTRLWCNLTARKGDEVQSNSSNVAGRQGIDWYDEARLDKVATEAVDRTMRLFDAVRPPAGELPVILDAGASGILLHEAIGHGLEADHCRKGMSIYSELLNKPVAPDFVNIIDDGLPEGERGSLAFDDEGTATERTTLVENGVLVNYLHDQISARHYGVPATGSGRRQSFRHVPMPRMRCTFMEDGPHTRDEIVASVEKGIIAETFTNGVVAIGAGDFTFYIKNGWLIEDGKVTAPIKDVNIIGNGPDCLKKVTMAANDGRLDTGGWTCGKDGQMVPVSQGLPTVLVSSMTVGGENA